MGKEPQKRKEATHQCVHNSTKTYPGDAGHMTSQLTSMYDQDNYLLTSIIDCADVVATTTRTASGHRQRLYEDTNSLHRHRRGTAAIGAAIT